MDTAGFLDEGRWLVEQRASLDRGEAEWLERLAAFDRDGLWELDGHFCCASWLALATRMARSTAFEKLRVAHELARRPIIAQAFRDGRLSYSAARAITRMDRPAAEVDEALVDLAESGASIADIERVVRSYGLYADQERPPGEGPEPGRDVRIRRGDGGTGEIVVTLGDLEVEEFAAALQAFIDLRYRAAVDRSSAGDTPRADGLATVDRSSGGDTPDAGFPAPSRSAGRADAFMDMVGAALAAADGGHAAGDDRYMVHLVTRDDGQSLSLLDGTPIPPADASVIGCDASTVHHSVTGRGEPLSLGRKTRSWTTAQRRAISVRDGGRCRFPGCTYRHYDIHHIRPWERGGLTDVANGICECRRHHRMLHDGYGVDGDPNGELRFYRPGGSYLGSTLPATARQLLPV